MRGVAFAFVAIAFVAAPHPVAAQCYGPECDRQRSGPPPQFNERPSFNERPNFNSNPANSGQLYRQAPFVQGQQFQGQPYQGQQDQGQQHQGQPYQGQPYQGQPYPQAPQSQPPYQRPAYQGQPRPPAGYADMPPGVAPRGRDYRPGPPGYQTNVRTQVVRTQVTKTPKATKSAVRRHQPGPTGRTVVTNAPPSAAAGQVTISVAEYRDLQNQARELQRLMSTKSGGANRATPFLDVRPPGPGNPPRQ